MSCGKGWDRVPGASLQYLNALSFHGPTLFVIVPGFFMTHPPIRPGRPDAGGPRDQHPSLTALPRATNIHRVNQEVMMPYSQPIYCLPGCYLFEWPRHPLGKGRCAPTADVSAPRPFHHVLISSDHVPQTTQFQNLSNPSLYSPSASRPPSLPKWPLALTCTTAALKSPWWAAAPAYWLRLR